VAFGRSKCLRMEERTMATTDEMSDQELIDALIFVSAPLIKALQNRGFGRFECNAG
jgi:hypothetical protein